MLKSKIGTTQVNSWRTCLLEGSSRRGGVAYLYTLSKKIRALGGANRSPSHQVLSPRVGGEVDKALLLLLSTHNHCLQTCELRKLGPTKSCPLYHTPAGILLLYYPLEVRIREYWRLRIFLLQYPSLSRYENYCIMIA